MAKAVSTTTVTMLVLYVWLCHQLASATTRYLPSASSSPWLSMSSSLSSPPLLSSNLLPQSELLSEMSPDKLTSTTKFTPSRTPSALAAKTLHRDLMRLVRLLPGVYTNTAQYQQEAGRSLPHQQRHVLLRSSYRPVSLGFLPRAFAVLVQDYSGASLFPFRQRVYTFFVDLAHRAIRMKVWNFATKRAEKRVTRNLNHFSTLRRKDLLSQGECDMFWRRLDKKTFMGITGKQCLGYVKGEQVRITVSMTLTSQLLQSNEGWYRTRDGKKLVEIDVPYNLLKTKSFQDHRKKQKIRTQTSAQSGRVQHNSTLNDIPQAPSLSSQGQKEDKMESHSPVLSAVRNVNTPRSPISKNTEPKPLATGGKNTFQRDKSRGQEKKNRNKEWILPDYDAIARALHSGHLVFYSVELSACSLPEQMKTERLSFGDFVDSFESTRGDRRGKEASIRFWQSKFVQGDEGMEQITREITIKSNGRVQVRLHRKYTNTNNVAWDQSARCKIYDPETGLGGVKMTSRPAADVHEITTFSRFRASLRRGRRQVRMIIDLTQCDGRLHSVKSILGITVRAYDFINNGKAIEVSQLTPDTDHTHYTLLTGHFLNNGEVVFITSLQPQTGSDVVRHLPLFYQASTFRCALSGSDVTNSNGPWGVRLFYTT